MRRIAVLVVVGSLVLAACSTSPAVSTTAASGPTSPTAAPTTAPTVTPSTATTSPDATTSTRPRPEGPDAPDFTLALGEGGSFTLSDEHRPVYLLFWAEW